MRRASGDKDSLWAAAVTGANGFSNVGEVGRGVDQIVIFVTVSGATTIEIHVAHFGDVNADGTLPEGATASDTFFPFFYLNDQMKQVFAGAGSAAIQIPDVAFQQFRLKSTASVTATAGFMAAAG